MGLIRLIFRLDWRLFWPGVRLDRRGIRVGRWLVRRGERADCRRGGSGADRLADPAASDDLLTDLPIPQTAVRLDGSFYFNRAGEIF